MPLGRVEPESPLWWKRYNILRSEGFVNDEAVVIACGRISTPEMVKGREKRKKWYKTIQPLGLSETELEDAVDSLYDEGDWGDPYDQFYPEA